MHFFSPSPHINLRKRAPAFIKNGTLASLAKALAIMVLPTPGGPIKSTPLGRKIPKSWYFLGFFK